MRHQLLTAIVAVLAASGTAHGMDLDEYQKAFPHTTGDADQRTIVARCLAAWAGSHPFKAVGEQSFRVIRPQVRVMGMGGQEVEDAITTDKPALVLIEPSVNVMTKTTFKLLNPNAWYCFDANVTVMGKSVVEVDCGAKLADGRSGVEVFGANDPDKQGVTVMGATEVHRVNCK